jgi:hypothetical protein
MPRSAAPGAGLGRSLAAFMTLAALACMPQRAAATPLPAPAAAPATWLARSAAQALQVAEREESVSAGAAALLNQSFANGFGELRRHAPDWLRGVDLRIEFREDFSTRYELCTVETLLDRPTADDRVQAEGRLVYDPAGLTSGQVGLRYERRIASEPVALGLQGSLEDRWLSDYQRLAVDAELQSFPLTLRARLIDDIPDESLRTNDIPDRRLDGYQLQLDLRLPYASWAQLCARKSWQIAVDSEQPLHTDGLSLRVQPFGPLQLEAGTIGNPIERSWFARIRLKVSLGGAS